MSNDPLHEVAWLELQVQASAALEVTLDHPDLTPLQAVLAKARTEAATAMRSLVSIDPAATREILRLQNEVRRYECLVGWLRDIMTDGKEAAEQLKRIYHERAEEFRAQISDPDEDQNGAQD